MLREIEAAVARTGDQLIAKVARSFGITESCLACLHRLAERMNSSLVDGPEPSTTEVASPGVV